MLFNDFSKIRISITTRSHTKERERERERKNQKNKNKNIEDKFIILQNLLRQKSNELNILAEGMVLSFLWWLKISKMTSKITFSNVHHYKNLFGKRMKTITFLHRKLSELHTKRHNFACDNIFLNKDKQSKQWTYYSALKPGARLVKHHYKKNKWLYKKQKSLMVTNICYTLPFFSC